MKRQPSIIYPTGTRFGKLVILDYLPPDGQGNFSRYKIKCDCGTEKVVRLYFIGDKGSRSCGKKGCVIKPLKGLLPDRLATKNAVLRGYKTHAIERKLEWSLTDQEAINIFEQDCHYCGSGLSNCSKPGMKVKTKGGEFYYNGIDRVNSAEGYKAGNVVPACRMCNRAKSNTTVDQFLVWISKVYNFQNLSKN